jgi:hypothetical protein
LAPLPMILGYFLIWVLMLGAAVGATPPPSPASG